MSYLVHKYGGTSVGDIERLRGCAARVAAARAERDAGLVVVVSAMGKATDELIALARGCGVDPLPARELDRLLITGEQQSAALMAMTLCGLGVDAMSMVAGEAGIQTDALHGSARIQAVEADVLRKALDAGRVVVVPGFQGVGPAGELTTLGRGGSDLTAVAIAAALDATCVIFTDVDGVSTADPRHVPHARRVPRIAYEEMAELASLGAGVLQTRAVLLGQRHGVPIHVRLSTGEGSGTVILKETPDMERVNVVGCALTSDLGRVTLRGIPNVPGALSGVFARIAGAGILVDDIIQLEDGATVDVAFTVEGAQLAGLKLAAQHALDALGSGRLDLDVGLAKVSAVGVGMRTHTGVAATMFEALAAAGINVANVTTSEIKISCLVPAERGPEALRVVHDAFELGEPERAAEVKVNTSPATRPAPA